MDAMHIVLATTALLGLELVVLGGLIVRQRYALRVSLGEGDGSAAHEPLRVAVRCHGNFIEYVPLSLLLLSGIAWAGAPLALVATLCGALLLARLAHPFGMYRPAPNLLRGGGIILTWAIIAVAAVTALALMA